MRAILIGLEGEEVDAFDIPKYLPYIDKPVHRRPRLSDYDADPSEFAGIRIRRFEAADRMVLGDETIVQVYRELRIY